MLIVYIVKMYYIYCTDTQRSQMWIKLQMWIDIDNECDMTRCHDKLTRDKMTYVVWHNDTDIMTWHNDMTDRHDTMTHDGMRCEEEGGMGWGEGRGEDGEEMMIWIRETLDGWGELRWRSTCDEMRLCLVVRRETKMWLKRCTGPKKAVSEEGGGPRGGGVTLHPKIFNIFF